MTYKKGLCIPVLVALLYSLETDGKNPIDFYFSNAIGCLFIGLSPWCDDSELLLCSKHTNIT